MGWLWGRVAAKRLMNVFSGGAIASRPRGEPCLWALHGHPNAANPAIPKIFDDLCPLSATTASYLCTASNTHVPERLPDGQDER